MGPAVLTLSFQQMQLVACFDLVAPSAGFPKCFVFVVCYSSGYPLAQPTFLPEREFGGLIPLLPEIRAPRFAQICQVSAQIDTARSSSGNG